MKFEDETNIHDAIFFNTDASQAILKMTEESPFSNRSSHPFVEKFRVLSIACNYY